MRPDERADSTKFVRVTARGPYFELESWAALLFVMFAFGFFAYEWNLERQRVAGEAAFLADCNATCDSDRDCIPLRTGSYRGYPSFLGECVRRRCVYQSSFDMRFDDPKATEPESSLDRRKSHRLQIRDRCSALLRWTVKDSRDKSVISSTNNPLSSVLFLETSEEHAVHRLLSTRVHCVWTIECVTDALPTNACPDPTPYNETAPPLFDFIGVDPRP